ncbi:hypothetical protein [Microcoleus sp. AT9b-C5]
MTYEESVAESINNLAAKEDLRRSLLTEKKLSGKLKITEQLLVLSERNESLSQQITAQLIAERHTILMPQFIPHSNFDPDLNLDLDNLPPLPEPLPKTKRKVRVPKVEVKKVTEMTLEEIQAELKEARAKMAVLEGKLISDDFDTRFNAQMDIRGLNPRMKKLSGQEIALLQHEIVCLRKSLLT